MQCVVKPDWLVSFVGHLGDAFAGCRGCLACRAALHASALAYLKECGCAPVCTVALPFPLAVTASGDMCSAVSLHLVLLTA